MQAHTNVSFQWVACKLTSIIRTYCSYLTEGTIAKITEEDLEFVFHVLDLGQYLDEFISTWKSKPRQPE